MTGDNPGLESQPLKRSANGFPGIKWICNKRMCDLSTHGHLAGFNNDQLFEAQCLNAQARFSQCDQANSSYRYIAQPEFGTMAVSTLLTRDLS
jgi:hypothetical protein